MRSDSTVLSIKFTGEQLARGEVKRVQALMTIVQPEGTLVIFMAVSGKGATEVLMNGQSLSAAQLKEQTGVDVTELSL